MLQADVLIQKFAVRLRRPPPSWRRCSSSAYPPGYAIVVALSQSADADGI